MIVSVVAVFASLIVVMFGSTAGWLGAMSAF